MPWRSVPKARTARGGQPRPGRSSSPSGSIASSGRSLAGSASIARHRQGEVQAGGAAHRVRVPGVVLAGGQNRGRVGRRGDPDAGADVPHVASAARAGPRAPARGSASTAARSTGGRRAIATTPVRGTSGTSSARSATSIGSTRPAEAPRQVRRQLGRQPLQLIRIDRHGLDQLSAEAQRVLEGVEALEDGQVGIAPRFAEAHRELMVAHRGHHDSIRGDWTSRSRPRRLGLVEGAVGPVDQVVAALGVVPAGEPGRAGQSRRGRCAQAFDRLRRLSQRAVGEDDEELLAAEAHDRVFAAQRRVPGDAHIRAAPRRRRDGRWRRCRP